MEDGFPISSRLMREIHKVLLTSGRGSDKNPGEFKRSQNWLGGTRPGNAHFVPTPPHETARCIGELEKFIHDDQTGLHTLLKAGLVHVQFETIHPFLDGNGRIGRMLVPLLLMQEGILDEPTLYLSLFLKEYRSEYYAHLQAVRETGNWESWLLFFLDGVRLVALDAVHAADSLQEIYQKDRQRLVKSGKNSKVVMQVHECMMVRQVGGIPCFGSRHKQALGWLVYTNGRTVGGEGTAGRPRPGMEERPESCLSGRYREQGRGRNTEETA